MHLFLGRKYGVPCYTPKFNFSPLRGEFNTPRKDSLYSTLFNNVLIFFI